MIRSMLKNIAKPPAINYNDPRYQKVQAEAHAMNYSGGPKKLDSTINEKIQGSWAAQQSDQIMDLREIGLASQKRAAELRLAEDEFAFRKKLFRDAYKQEKQDINTAMYKGIFWDTPRTIYQTLQEKKRVSEETNFRKLQELDIKKRLGIA